MMEPSTETAPNSPTNVSHLSRPTTFADMKVRAPPGRVLYPPGRNRAAPVAQLDFRDRIQLTPQGPVRDPVRTIRPCHDHMMLAQNHIRMPKPFEIHSARHTLSSICLPLNGSRLPIEHGPAAPRAGLAGLAPGCSSWAGTLVDKAAGRWTVRVPEEEASGATDVGAGEKIGFRVRAEHDDHRSGVHG